MKSLYRHIAAISLATLLIVPQFYKSVHIFADHHGHLHCEAMKNSKDGLHEENDHCLLCSFQITTFDQPKPHYFPSIQPTNPTTFLFDTTAYNYSQPASHYLLRAPPHLFKPTV